MGAAGIATRIAGAQGFDTDLEMMQDVLYDVLATGIDAGQTTVTRADIERFLHEHARTTKSAAEFREFFDRHGLHADMRTAESAILELPPITTSREPSAPIVEAPIELTLSDIEPGGLQDDPFAAKRPPPLPGRRRARRTQWLVAAGLLIALGLLAWRGVVMINELRAEVSRASARHQQDRNAIQHLSDQTANLESSVAATSELVQRMDQKSDLLIDSLLRPKPPVKPRVEAPQPPALPPSPEPTPPESEARAVESAPPAQP